MEGLSVWEQSGVVIISGLLIVFIGLVLLILVIWVMGSIAKAVQNRGQKPAPPAAPPALKREAPAPQAKAQPLQAEAQKSGVDGQLIAVITAAIEAMTGKSGVRIMSVKRAARPAGRSAWSQAGIIDNTRPF